MSAVENSGALAVTDQNFDDTPEGWKQRWVMEFDAARKEHKDWQVQAEHITNRYLDKRTGAKDADMTAGIQTRRPVFTSTVNTKRAMLYGKVPAVSATPKFADAPDSVARLAGETLERVLNGDIEDPTDGYRDALHYALMDRLVPGVAVMRFRYVAEFEADEEHEGELTTDEDDEEAEPVEKKTYEAVETDYVHWKDVLWSPCRTFQDMRWAAFKAELSKRDLKKKFGDDVAKQIALNTKKEAESGDSKKADPWQRADIWEIWDKEHRCVWFFSEAAPFVLKPVDLDDAQFNENGSQKDPLELEGFFPFPAPWLANTTPSAFLPRADYTLHQDLLEEMDRVATRITDMARAIRVAGVYDKDNPALQRILNESQGNQLLPVENFAKLAATAGSKDILANAIALLPLQDMIAALDRLEAEWNTLAQVYYQVSGDSDLSRGQQVENGTPGEAQVKARFASVRMQALQDEFARWASDGQRIKAEIMAKHFDPQTFIERSNIGNSFDQQDPKLMEAIDLIKSGINCYRIEIKPEALALSDFDQMKQQRAEVMGAISEFIQSVVPLVQMMPTALPPLLEMLQWSVSGLPGASTMEGILEKAIQSFEQAQAQAAANPQPQQPDPKLLAQQQKGQQDMQKIQATTQSELIRMQAETQALAERKANDAQMDVKEEMAKQAIKAHYAPEPTMPKPGGGT